MKKNIHVSLLLITMSASLSASTPSLTADEAVRALNARIRDLNSAQTRSGSMQVSQAPSSNHYSNDQGGFLDSLKKEKLEGEAKAQGKIAEAFKAMDNWIKKNPVTKVKEATKYMNDALDSLAKSIGGSPESMKSLKAAANSAITFFTTESVITTRGTISNKVLAGIVNSVKLVTLAPVKLALHTTVELSGAALGAAGGAVAGFGAGINRTVSDIANISIRSAGKITFQDSALLLPRVVVRSLIGVAEIATLTAYGTLNGLSVGKTTGSKVANKLFGENIFTLGENPQVKAEQEQAKAEQEQAKAKLEAAEQRAWNIVSKFNRYRKLNFVSKRQPILNVARDKNGNTVIDKNGNVVIEDLNNRQIVTDENGNLMNNPQIVTDENGNLMYEGNIYTPAEQQEFVDGKSLADIQAAQAQSQDTSGVTNLDGSGGSIINPLDNLGLSNAQPTSEALPQKELAAQAENAQMNELAGRLEYEKQQQQKQQTEVKANAQKETSSEINKGL